MLNTNAPSSDFKSNSWSLRFKKQGRYVIRGRGTKKPNPRPQ